MAKDGTFAPYTIVTGTLKEGESAPVVPPQKRGPKKGATYKTHEAIPRACGCAGAMHKMGCEHYIAPQARACGCKPKGPHKSSCLLSGKAKRMRGGPGAGPIPGA